MACDKIVGRCLAGISSTFNRVGERDGSLRRAKWKQRQMTLSQPQVVNEAVFEFIDAVHDAPTFGDVNTLFRRLIRSWGFDRWNCVQLSSSAAGFRQALRRSFGQPNAAFQREYKEGGFVFRDPAAREVMRRPSAFWWSEVATKPGLSKSETEVFHLAREFGGNEGLTVPIRFPDGSVWACVLIGEAPEKSQQIADAGQIASQFYAGRALFLRDLQRRELAPAGRLTDRQRKLVQLVRFGNTQTDVARMTGLSESTVNNELAEARKRLDCTTIAELVAEALLNGEIDSEASS